MEKEMDVSWSRLFRGRVIGDSIVTWLGELFEYPIYYLPNVPSSVFSIRHLGGTLIEAGSDTTSSFTQSLVLALVAFPEVQKKAQAELDSVFGTDRVPTFEDLERLPYIRAVINEVHRFRPNAPLIPHAATEDVKVCYFTVWNWLYNFLCAQYRGHTIPAGATILINLCEPHIFVAIGLELVLTLANLNICRWPIP